MLNFLVRLIVSLYLRSALLIGCHRHVYLLTSKWGEGSVRMPVRYRVAVDIQPQLLSWGYNCCPSCFWATVKPNEHIEVKGSWCWEQTFPDCACCGRPEPCCPMASEADMRANEEEQRGRRVDDDIAYQEWLEDQRSNDPAADIETYAEEQRREDELREDREELMEMERAAARESFEDEQFRQQQEADEEGLGGDCGQQMYEPCGCPLYECTCDEYDGTPEDAMTDFVDSWSPVHGVVLLPGDPNYDEPVYEELEEGE